MEEKDALVDLFFSWWANISTDENRVALTLTINITIKEEDTKDRKEKRGGNIQSRTLIRFYHRLLKTESTVFIRQWPTLVKYVQRRYQPYPNVLPYVFRLSIEECLKYTWSSCWTIGLLPRLRTGKSSISKALLQKYSVHESKRSHWLWWPDSLEGLMLLLNNFLQKQWLKALIWRECRSVPIGTHISSIRRDCRSRKQSSSQWHRRRCPMRMFRARERWNSMFLLYRNCVQRQRDERPLRDLGSRAHVLQRTLWRSKRIWQCLRWWWISSEASAAKMFDIQASVSHVRRYILDRRHGLNSTEDSIHCWLTMIDRVEEDSKATARRGQQTVHRNGIPARGTNLR